MTVTVERLELLCELINAIIKVYNEVDEYIQSEQIPFEKIYCMRSKTLGKKILIIKGVDGSITAVIPRAYFEEILSKSVNRNTLKAVIKELLIKMISDIKILESTEKLIEYIRIKTNLNNSTIILKIRECWRVLTSKKWYILFDINQFKVKKQALVYLLLNIINKSNKYWTMEELIKLVREHEINVTFSLMDAVIFCLLLSILRS